MNTTEMDKMDEALEILKRTEVGGHIYAPESVWKSLFLAYQNSGIQNKPHFVSWDGIKIVQADNSSSKRKMSVGGKRW